jgi:hypothetical protein
MEKGQRNSSLTANEILVRIDPAEKKGGLATEFRRATGVKTHPIEVFGTVGGNSYRERPRSKRNHEPGIRTQALKEFRLSGSHRISMQSS